MNTQQRQQMSRIRREQQRVQQSWQLLQHSDRGIDPIFNRLALFNTVKELDHLSNVERMRHHKTPIVFGDHWLHWLNPQGHWYVAHQREQISRDRLGAIERIVYRQDNINLTTHAIERLWQRSGQGIAEYQDNFGLGDITPYLSQFSVITSSALLDPNQMAVRTDIPLPYRQGLFLGSVAFGEGSMSFDSKGVKFSKHTHKYCAMTWIAPEQLKPNQQVIRDALLAGQWNQAADLVKQEVWMIEAFDPVELTQNFNQELAKLWQNPDTSVERI